MLPQQTDPSNPTVKFPGTEMKEPIPLLLRENAARRDFLDFSTLIRFYINIPGRFYCSNTKCRRRMLAKKKTVNSKYIQVYHPLVLRHLVLDLDYGRSKFF